MKIDSKSEQKYKGKNSKFDKSNNKDGDETGNKGDDEPKNKNKIVARAIANIFIKDEPTPTLAHSSLLTFAN